MMSHAAALDVSQAQAWLIVITAIFTGVVSVISAIKSKNNGAKLDAADKKLDVIHVQTNSNLTSVKADLEIARKDISFLKEFISKNVTAPEPDAAKPEFIAKVELAPSQPPAETRTPLMP